MSAVAQPAPPPAKQRGRPRSPERHHAILESTRALLVAGTYEQLTIEAIAAGAGVSKQTVYKWWPSKAAVVTEAVMSGYVTVPDERPVDSGDLAADLGAWLRVRFAEIEDPNVTALVRAMTVAAAEGTDADRIYATLAEPHRKYLLGRLTSASAQGQLRADLDLDAVVEAILGALWLRTFRRGETSQASADGLLRVLLEGSLKPTGSGRRR